MKQIVHAPYWHKLLDESFCKACGDWWPCLVWREQQPPKCKCSHSKHDGNCMRGSCGCWIYRPAVAA